MRIPRRVQLHEESGVVHKIWRCHNREHYMRDNHVKRMYLDQILAELKKDEYGEFVKLHAYCVMDNHSHDISRYFDGSVHLSNFMRQTHSGFGRKYNNMKNRTGKVAEARPKTPPIENTEHQIRCQFYVDANPIKAGKVKLENLKYYEYSSYGFYAFGRQTKYTKMLTLPDWYLELGRTARQRQRAYRRLFADYLMHEPLPSSIYMDCFIGSALWVMKQKEWAREYLNGERSSYQSVRSKDELSVVDTS